MTLNLGICKDYWFSHGKLISIKTGKEYKIRICEGDRFYHYIKQYIMNGKADSATDIKIDELFITDPHAEFLQEEILKIDTLMNVEYRNNQCFTYKLEMDNVTITDIKSYELKDSDIERVMPLCTLKISHNTEISVSEVMD